MVQRGGLRALRVANLLLLVLIGGTAPFSRRHHSICPRLICWMIEQCADVMHEEWVEHFSYLFLVGEVQCTFEWYPDFRLAVSKQSKRKQPYQTPLRCIGPIFTTCRSFSLLRIPSLRPRVIPATLRSFVPLMKWLSVPCQSPIVPFVGQQRIS